MSSRALVILVVMAAMPAVFANIVYAGNEFKFWAAEDAWVNEGNAGANYGNNTYLSVKDRSELAEVFIKFSRDDLNFLLGQKILSASLRLYQYDYNYSPGDVINVHQVTVDWSEGGINWSNKPVFKSEALSVLELSNGNNQWREWTGLEGLVSSWMKESNYGLAIENNLDMKNGELFARFYSSEFSDTEKRPYLQVQTAPEPVSVALFVAGGCVLGLAKLRRRES